MSAEPICERRRAGCEERGRGDLTESIVEAERQRRRPPPPQKRPAVHFVRCSKVALPVRGGGPGRTIEGETGTMSPSRIFVILCAFASPALLVLVEELKGGADSCPVAQKVSSLLASWKAATDDAKGLYHTAQEKLVARLAALAKECPIGSRVGPTVAAAKDVLAAAVASEEARAKACPLSAPEKRGARSEAGARG